MKTFMNIFLLSIIITLFSNIAYVMGLNIKDYYDKNSITDEQLQEIKEILNKDNYYLVFVNNTYGEFKIYSNEKYGKREKSQIFVESLIEEINDLIVKDIDTYQYPEKLEKLEITSKLKRKKNGENSNFFISNSNYIYPVSSVKDSVVFCTYLSKSLVKKVCSLESVYDCSPKSDNFFIFNSYYNTYDILKETNWSSLKVQDYADFHLSLISQGKYDKNLINKFDPNYYYPSSAGKDIDIVIMDNNFNFNYPEFSNTNERTAKCVASINNGQADIDINQSFCGTSVRIPHGGIIADIAGGLVRGVAKSSNIYAVTVNTIEKGYHTDLDMFGGMQYIYEKLIRPHKTVVNFSFVKAFPNTSSEYKQFEKIINSIIEKGAIVVASAGNEAKRLSKDSIVYLPCEIDNVICVGGINNYDISNIYTVAEISNYGPSVDIYAPLVAKADILNDQNIVESIFSAGTSNSSPIVAGMIATYMSENPKKKFSLNKIKKFLKENGTSESFEYEGEICLLANNGKHIVYSNDNIYYGCGIHAGNRPCSTGTTKKTTTTKKKSNNFHYLRKMWTKIWCLFRYW